LTLVVLAPVALVACIISVSQGIRTEELDRNALRQEVTSPVRAHLRDGSTALYPNGIIVSATMIDSRGRGSRVGPLNESIPLTPIPLDSVIGLETYAARTNVPVSVLLSAGAMAATAAASAVAAVLIFGSCPTIYADSAGTPVLQAEVFATRISPLLEARDIDLLTARADSAGRLTLDVRNEALETHYINHFELLEIRHIVGQRLIPDEHGRPLLVGRFGAVTARDRLGRDVTALVGATDGSVFSTDSVTLARATGADPFDYVDITVPRPRGDSAVVGLHLRNSLLNTVLLYDLMLAAPGARSLDWLAQDMRRIGPMFQFGRWYRQHFGLRVHVFDGRRWQEVERHPTYGPVAWREAATVVPVLQSDSLRVRLTFAADEWRIDWIGVADGFWRPRPRLHAIASVRTRIDSLAAPTKRNLSSADDRYVETTPGERFWVSFDVGPEPRDSTRSYLLASQGYYTEWLRGQWIAQATDSVPFKPGPAALTSAFQRWSAKRDSLHKAFFSARVPVRAW
jgi:hypothetical protein